MAQNIEVSGYRSRRAGGVRQALKRRAHRAERRRARHDLGSLVLQGAHVHGSGY